MGGRPVWLASCSVRDLRREDPWRKGEALILTTDKWSPLVRTEAERQIRIALAGVGDELLQRCFRMCVTLCVHRAVTGAELAGLPAEWTCAVGRDLAGGPVEVLWHTSAVPHVPSAQPCANPGKRPVAELAHLGVYIPEDCGGCDACRARQVVQAAAVKRHEAWVAQGNRPQLRDFQQAGLELARGT